MAVQPVVETVGAINPPASPDFGDCHIVGMGANADWSGHDHALAMFGDGGWIFIAPFEGMSVFDIGSGALRRFVAGTWTEERLQGALLDVNGDQVVGTRQSAIPSPSGGANVDAEARLAIDALITAIKAHGLIAPN